MVENAEDLTEEEFLAQLREEYVREWCILMAELEKAVLDCEEEKVRAMSHDLMGSGSTMSCPKVTDLGGNLSDAAKAGEWGESLRIVKDLTGFFQSELAKYKKG